MTLNTSKCNRLTPLCCKGLTTFIQVYFQPNIWEDRSDDLSGAVRNFHLGTIAQSGGPRAKPRYGAWETEV